mmetsp:Transcript_66654/g.152653  ORF Transcript_66654/g.152653 Transcript_66654/m.152653 type:complete len:225 (-) Transcript_66654:649-1323(-)
MEIGSVALGGQKCFKPLEKIAPMQPRRAMDQNASIFLCPLLRVQTHRTYCVERQAKLKLYLKPEEIVVHSNWHATVYDTAKMQEHPEISRIITCAVQQPKSVVADQWNSKRGGMQQDASDDGQTDNKITVNECLVRNPHLLEQCSIHIKASTSIRLEHVTNPEVDKSSCVHQTWRSASRCKLRLSTYCTNLKKQKSQERHNPAEVRTAHGNGDDGTNCCPGIVA